MKYFGGHYVLSVTVRVDRSVRTATVIHGVPQFILLAGVVFVAVVVVTEGIEIETTPSREIRDLKRQPRCRCSMRYRRRWYCCGERTAATGRCDAGWTGGGQESGCQR